MKYEEMFKDPQQFTDGSYVIGGWYTKVEAAQLMAEESGKDIEPEDLEEDLARFGFHPETIEGSEDFDGPIWY